MKIAMVGRVGLLLTAALSFGLSGAEVSIIPEPLPGKEPVHPGFTSHAIVLRDGAVLAYYVRRARGDAPSLVLLPGTHGDRSRFLAQGFVEMLPQALGLVIIEARGQGRSWPPPGERAATMEHYAEDVLAVVAAAKLRKWYVSGHSLGGMVAIEIVGRKAPALRGAIPLEGWPHHTVQRVAFPAASPVDANSRQEAQRVRQERYRLLRWTPAEYARVVRMWELWESGKSILMNTSLPVLMVWGDRDLREKPSRARLGMPDRENIKIAWIPGSDHNVMSAQAAAEVAKVVAGFISEVEDHY